MKFTIIQSKTNISKSFILNKKGELEKKDGGNLHTGSFRTADMSIAELGKFIKSCSHKEIIIQGLTDYDTGLITTKSGLKKYENADHATVARSKEFFSYKEEEGFLLLDYDPNEFYKEGEILSKEAFLEKIYTAVPEIKDSPHLWKTSSGSNIVKTFESIKNSEGETEEHAVYDELTGLKGQHLLIHVKNMETINDFFVYLYQKLWCNGEGYVFIDKVGRLHDRTIVDRVVNSPEREIFLKACLNDKEACALRQDVQVEVYNQNAPALDLAEVLKTVDTEEVFLKLYSNAMKKNKAESKKRLDSYLTKNADKHGISKESLKLSIVERKLFSDFKIKLHDNTYVTVDAILENPDQYSGMYCYEPFEPEYGGYCNTKGWIDAHNERIYSHAHGGIEYELVDFKKKSPDQLAHYLLGIKSEKQRYKEAGELTAKYKYELTEIDSLLKKLSDSTGQRKTTVEKTFKKYNKGQTDNTDSVVSANYDINSPWITKYDLPLDMRFPHTDLKDKVSSTASNLKFLLDHYGVEYSYNTVTKESIIHIPRGSDYKESDIQAEANYYDIQSMCVVNGMTKDTVNYIASVANNNRINPLYDWIKSESWDGVDRLPAFIDRIKTNFQLFEDKVSNIGFSNTYMEKVVKMWLVQCIAALDGAENTPISHPICSFEYVLVFVGAQGIGKTKFLSSLVPREFRDHVVTGHELDTKNKDSVKKAISSWICELGELDSTFKKSEISSLKAFLSDEVDIIRLPYGRTEIKLKRSTAFAGSVNTSDFLKDKTGNRRYLPVPVISLDPLYAHVKGTRNDILDIEELLKLQEENDKREREEKEAKEKKASITDVVGEEGGGEEEGEEGEERLFQREIDLPPMSEQQLWAQILDLYLKGEQWWPDDQLGKMLINVTADHSQVGIFGEALPEFIHIERNDLWRDKYHVINDNRRYVKQCQDQVRENVANGEGFGEFGSLDEGMKSISLLHGKNLKDLLYLMGIENSRNNSRELGEEMARLGFKYGVKKVNGTAKKCYFVCLKSKGDLIDFVGKDESKGVGLESV